jgi:hypothetical protein
MRQRGNDPLKLREKAKVMQRAADRPRLQTFLCWEPWELDWDGSEVFTGYNTRTPVPTRDMEKLDLAALMTVPGIPGGNPGNITGRKFHFADMRLDSEGRETWHMPENVSPVYICGAETVTVREYVEMLKKTTSAPVLARSIGVMNRIAREQPRLIFKSGFIYVPVEKDTVVLDSSYKPVQAPEVECTREGEVYDVPPPGARPPRPKRG